MLLSKTSNVERERKMTKLKRRNLDEGQQLVAAWEASGLSMAKFAEQIGVTLCAIRYWASKIRNAGKEQSAKVRLLEVIQTNRSRERQSSIIELPGGIKIQTEELPPPEYLAELSEQFQRKMPC